MVEGVRPRRPVRGAPERPGVDCAPRRRGAGGAPAARSGRGGRRLQRHARGRGGGRVVGAAHGGAGLLGEGEQRGASTESSSRSEKQHKKNISRRCRPALRLNPNAKEAGFLS